MTRPGQQGGGPLGWLVGGMLLVIADIRVDGFDVIPDVLGWVLVVLGLAQLRGRHPWFALAAAAAAMAGLGSVLQLVEESGLVGDVQTVLETVVVFGTCSGIRAVAREPGVRATATRLRWIDLGLAVAALVLVLTLGSRGPATPSVGPEAVGVLVALGLATLVVMVWFLVFCWTHRRDPELVARPPVPA